MILIPIADSPFSIGNLIYKGLKRERGSISAINPAVKNYLAKQWR
jgi:hypothetical protein